MQSFNKGVTETVNTASLMYVSRPHTGTVRTSHLSMFKLALRRSCELTIHHQLQLESSHMHIKIAEPVKKLVLYAGINVSITFGCSSFTPTVLPLE